MGSAWKSDHPTFQIQKATQKTQAKGETHDGVASSVNAYAKTH